VKVGQESPTQLAVGVKKSVTSSEQSDMSLDWVQSLQTLVTECKDIFWLKMGTDPLANVKTLFIKLRDFAESERMSARKYASSQLKLMRDKIRELEDLNLVFKGTRSE
jgi:hypothetical protein